MTCPQDPLAKMAASYAEFPSDYDDNVDRAGVVNSADGPIIIHAMLARQKFLR